MDRKVQTESGERIPLYKEDWKAFEKRPVQILARRMPVVFFVETPEGVMKGNAGDWLIRGIKGELYPCKPDIFEATYEKLSVWQWPKDLKEM